MKTDIIIIIKRFQFDTWKILIHKRQIYYSFIHFIRFVGQKVVFRCCLPFSFLKADSSIFVFHRRIIKYYDYCCSCSYIVEYPASEIRKKESACMCEQYENIQFSAWPTKLAIPKNPLSQINSNAM